MSDLKGKNILFLCSWYPTRVLGNNGNFVFKHARCLVRNGIPITALTVCEDMSLSNRFEMVEGEEDGVESLIIYYSYPFRLLKFFYKAIGYFKGIRHLKKKKGAFDLIHAQVLLDAGIIAWWINFWEKIPFILTEHSTVFLPIDPNGYPRVLKPLIRRVIKRCSYILPVSYDLETSIKKIYADTPFEIIPNVVDTKLFQPAKKIKKPTYLKFLHISTFSEQKNVEGLLRGFKKVSEQRSDFTLTIAGNGDFEELTKLVKTMNFAEGVIFLKGKMDENEVAATFNDHDVFVLFSHHENLPCVLVEAQACGLPIITTDVGGSDEVVDSKDYGIVIQARDEVALVSSINEMLNNFGQYNSQKIRAIAVERYSDDAVAKSFMEVYRSVLKLK